MLADVLVCGLSCAALPCRGVQDFQDIMRVNILGPFLVTQALLPLIRKGSRKQVPGITPAYFCRPEWPALRHALGAAS